MDKNHEQAKTTRERNAERRAAAEAKSAESKAQIMEVLTAVGKSPDASVEQKLEAARLAVQLQSRGY